MGSATITATVTDGANFTYSGMKGYDSAAETASQDLWRRQLRQRSGDYGRRRDELYTFMNMFVGNTSGAAIEVGETDGSMVNYYLSSGEFKSVKQKLTVPDGKCYLQLPSSAAGAPKRAGISADSTADTYQIVENNDILVLSVDVDGNMTGMEDLLKAAVAEKDVYYNLKGQRVEHPVKGIYVKNGRKVVVK